MAAVQSSIRAEIERGGVPPPSGAAAFLAYAIASAKGLIPEMEYAARLTLDEPMTFEVLGEVLREFDGRALSNIASVAETISCHVSNCFSKLVDPHPISGFLALGLTKVHFHLCPDSVDPQRQLG